MTTQLTFCIYLEFYLPQLEEPKSLFAIAANLFFLHSCCKSEKGEKEKAHIKKKRTDYTSNILL